MRKKYFLITFFSSLFFLFILFVFYFLYSQQFLIKKSTQLALEKNIGTTQTILKQLDYEYELFKQNQSTQAIYITLEDLNTDINQLTNFQAIRLNNLSKLETNPTNVLVLKTETTVGYLTLETFFTVLNDHNPYNYFIASKDGTIIHSYNSKYQANTLTYYLSSEGSADFIKHLSLENGSFKTKFDNRSTYFSFTHLNSNLLLIQTVLSSHYRDIISPLTYQGIALILIIVAAFSIYGFLLNKEFNAEETGNKFYETAKKTEVCILTIDSRGKILKVSEKYKPLARYQSIFNFSDMSIQEPKDLRNKHFFVAGVFNKTYHFTIIPQKETFILIGEDLEKTAKYAKYYKELAFLNIKTKIPNLLAFNQYMDEASQKKIEAIAMFDIKDFRNLIQIHGVKHADHIIDYLIKNLKQSELASNAKLFHVRSDVFIMIYENTQLTKEQLKIKIETYLSQYQKTIEINQVSMKINLKAALILNKEIIRTNPGEKLYEILVLTMNKAKKSNLYDYIEYDQELSYYLTQEETMRKDFEQALKTPDQFMMYLQPKYHILKKKIDSYEALLRWNHEKYIHTSPSKYIQLAEEDSLINEVGKMTIEKILQIFKLNPNINIALNISAKQLLEPGFINYLQEKTKEHQVSPSKIVLELTETILVQSFDLVSDKLKLLKQLGFKIHLDDFGTGYSSLKYLKDLPVDAIKIDKQFIDHIVLEENSKVIVKMLIDLAHNLNLTVIAEGVETKEQAEILAKLGCDYLQGYYIGKPNQASIILTKKGELS